MFRKRQKAPKPRFFLYVSDTKVDMLLSQIPRPALSKIAAEITVDVKVLQVKISQVDTQDNSRFDRALAVTQYLEKSEMVGGIDSSSMYVRTESMPMRWGRIAQDPRAAQQAPPSTAVMFFGEQTGLRVCLTGSLHHMIGAAPRPTIDSGWNPGSLRVEPPSYYAYLFNDVTTPEEFDAADMNGDMQSYVTHYYRDIYDPMSGVSTENLSFVARVIRRWGDDQRYLLGSPIWVSVSNP